MMSCLLCGSQSVHEELSVGSHPVSTFYLESKDAPERDFRLALGQCEACGTIQSTSIVPHDALVAPYDWLFAREPEEHLDEVAENLISLLNMNEETVVGAITYKDDTTVDRLMRLGCSRSWRLSLSDDLGIENPNANVETVQKLLTPALMDEVAQKRGLADVLICRHIFEHSEDPIAFLNGLAMLVKPEGILMLEVPDCTTSLRLNDYCMIWEEHSIYFTPATFTPVPTIAGFSPIRMDVYPLPFENCMVSISRKVNGPGALQVSDEALSEKGMLVKYAAPYEKTKREIRALLEEYRAKGGPIALFGAGHLACAFVNFLEVGDLIDFVADDTPQKIGKYLPGARIPIVSSEELVKQGASLCLLALSISNEDKVISRNESFERAGGKFASIFRASERSIFR